MLLYLDSTDHYNTSSEQQKYINGVAEGFTISAGAGAVRGGLNAIAPSTFGAPTTAAISSAMVRNLSATKTTLIAGGAFFLSTMPQVGNGTSSGVFMFLDNGVAQVSILIDASGAIRVISGFEGNGFGAHTFLGASPPDAIRPNCWSYIEAKVLFQTAAGTVQIRVNGVQVLSLVGLNTAPSTNNYATQFGVYKGAGLGGSFTAYTRDVYLCDDLAGINNNFLGDVGVTALFPNGAGANTMWTPSAGANWQCVDDPVPNGDTDYVSSSVALDRDTYTMTNLPAGAFSVKGIQNLQSARKTDAGARAIASSLRSGGVNYDGTVQSISSAYQYYLQQYDLDPSTTAAWTVGGVNALEAGEIVS